MEPSQNESLRRFVPPRTVEAWQVSRQGLSRRIELALTQSRVVVLHAPHGYGKTTLMSAVASERRSNASWLSLTAADGNPEILLQGILLSTSEQARTAPGPPDLARQASAREGISSVIQTANLLSRPYERRLVLLDDFEQIRSSHRSLATLRQLLDFTAPGLRFLIATRWWPYSDAGFSSIVDTAVLNFDDLAISLQELEDNLAGMDVTFERWRLAVSACQATGGWPAAVGLALAPSTPWLGADRVDVAGYLGPAVDRLVREALSGCTDHGAGALRRLAQFARLDPEMVGKVVTDRDADRLVADLRDNGLLVMADANGPCTLNPLVRRWRHARRDGDSLSARDHQRIADLYASRNDPLNEVRHRMLAGDWARCGARLPDIVDLLDRSVDPQSLQDLLAAYEKPSEPAIEEQWLHVRFRAAQALGRTREAIACVSDLIERLEGRGEDVSGLLHRRGLARRNVGDFAAAEEDVVRALEYRGDDKLLRVRCYQLLGTLHATSLRFGTAAHHFQCAVEVAREEGLPRYAFLYADVSQYEIILGRLDSAFALATQTIEHGDRHLLYQSMALARNALGLYWQAHGEISRAALWFDEAILIAQRSQKRVLEALLWLSQGDLAMERNDLEAARCRYRRALAIATIVDQPEYISYALSGLAGIERLRGRYAEAGRLLVAARDPLGEALRYDLAVWSLRKAQLHIEEDRIGLALGELNETIDALRAGQARLDLARGLLLRANALFLVHGLGAAYADLDELLDCVATIGTSQFLSPHARRMPRLLRALAAAAKAGPYAEIIGLGSELSPERRNGHVTTIAQVDDPHPGLLNRRELEVVFALCEGLSRDEVSARVGRSRSTVDKLISSIYGATGFEATHQIVAWAYRCGLWRPPAGEA